MACNCKVGQQIDYLHKKYGDNIPQSKKTNIRGSVMAAIENFIIRIALIPLIPFIAGYAIYALIKGEPIHIDKLTKIAKNV